MRSKKINLKAETKAIKQVWADRDEQRLNRKKVRKLVKQKLRKIL